jgi:hypothetical protein
MAKSKHSDHKKKNSDKMIRKEATGVHSITSKCFGTDKNLKMTIDFYTTKKKKDVTIKELRMATHKHSDHKKRNSDKRIRKEATGVHSITSKCFIHVPDT